MRAHIVAAALSAALIPTLTIAHGPQIQITNDNQKIVTRELYLDGPYSTTLSSERRVYVMPVLAFNNVWYARPNNEIDPILSVPEFPSGPGIVYGYDLADGGPQAFETGSIISIGFTAGLKRWDGTTFSDAGITEAKAFRGSDPSISGPAVNFAVTSDSGPYDSLSLSAVAAGYGADGPEVHASLRFALLGDGTSPTSPVPDGIYFLSMQLSSTQPGLAPSDPYSFVLNKGMAWSVVESAVNSIVVSGSLVQWLVPEPGSMVLWLPTITAFARLRIRGKPCR